MDNAIIYVIVGIIAIVLLMKWNNNATDNEARMQKSNKNNYWSVRRREEIDARAKASKDSANIAIIVWVIIICGIIYYFAN